jgi:hypothetical protein
MAGTRSVTSEEAVLNLPTSIIFDRLDSPDLAEFSLNGFDSGLGNHS